MIIKRHKDSHKGSNGVVLTVAGSKMYTGAPIFTALGAMKAGCDLSYLLAPERAANAACHWTPDLITMPLEGNFLAPAHVKHIENFFEKADALAIGPGLGKDKETEKAIFEIIKQFNKPMVIDADALHAVAKNIDIIKGKKVVFTPHRKEFEALTGKLATDEAAMSFAAKHNCTILLKAPTDIITDGRKILLNNTGNAGMTVGGTGDILTGVVAGLISQKMSLLDAAFYGAKANGIAGDLCYDELGYSLLASDVLEKVPIALKKI